MKKKIVWYKLFLTIFVSFRMLFRISFYDLNEKVPRFDIDVTLPNRFYVITVSIFSNCLNEKSVSHKLFFMLLYIIHVNLSINVWELNEKWGDPNLISHARFSAYTHVGRAWNLLFPASTRTIYCITRFRFCFFKFFEFLKNEWGIEICSSKRFNAPEWDKVSNQDFELCQSTLCTRIERSYCHQVN